MGRAKYYTLFRILDATLLTTVLIIQSVILSQYTIYSQFHEVVPSTVLKPIYQKIIWLGGDFICLTLLLLACLCGFKHLIQTGFKHLVGQRHEPPKQSNLNPFEESFEEEHSAEENGKERNSLVKYFTSQKIPLCYISWFMYAALLSAKIALIFTWNINENWREGQQKNYLFGPHMFQLGVCLSSVIFSLLVEAHHIAGIRDPQRNAYLSTVAYEVALEILDTACLLSYLIPSFDYGEGHASSPSPSAALGRNDSSTELTLPITLLSAVNLILPTVTLYKLTSTNFGETYHVKLELIYKTLHLLFVDIPFLVIRIHVWNKYDREDVIFMMKNVYGIFWFFRGVYSDVHALREEKKKDEPEHEHGWEMSSVRGRMVAPKVNQRNNRNYSCGVEKRGSDSIETRKYMLSRRRD